MGIQDMWVVRCPFWPGNLTIKVHLSAIKPRKKVVKKDQKAIKKRFCLRTESTYLKIYEDRAVKIGS